MVGNADHHVKNGRNTTCFLGESLEGVLSQRLGPRVNEAELVPRSMRAFIGIVLATFLLGYAMQCENGPE